MKKVLLVSLFTLGLIMVGSSTSYAYPTDPRIDRCSSTDVRLQCSSKEKREKREREEDYKQCLIDKRDLRLCQK